MIVIIYKKDFLGYPFSDSYVTWIKETAKAVRNISESEIVVESKDPKEVWSTLVFLGYAWGQQDNGR